MSISFPYSRINTKYFPQVDLFELTVWWFKLKLYSLLHEWSLNYKRKIIFWHCCEWSDNYKKKIIFWHCCEWSVNYKRKMILWHCWRSYTHLTFLRVKWVLFGKKREKFLLFGLCGVCLSSFNDLFCQLQLKMVASIWEEKRNFPLISLIRSLYWRRENKEKGDLGVRRWSCSPPNLLVFSSVNRSIQCSSCVIQCKELCMFCYWP